MTVSSWLRCSKTAASYTRSADCWCRCHRCLSSKHLLPKQDKASKEALACLDAVQTVLAQAVVKLAG